MIKINLLPREVRPEENRIFFRLSRLRLCLLTVILVLLLPAVVMQVWFFWLESRENEMAPILRRAEDTLSEREEVLNKVGALKQKINNLKEIQTGQDWGYLITGIGNAVPPDVWLSKIELQSDGTASLTGGSLTYSSIGEFARGLTGVSGVEYVTIKTVRSTEKENSVINEFEILCLLEEDSRED